MKTAPEPLAPIPFHLSEPFETRLKNGLRIVLCENDRLPLINFRLAFYSGDADEPSDAIGLTSAVAALLTEGTENYSSRELAEKVDRLGAHLSANSSEDFLVIAASALAMYEADLIDLLAEVLFRPTFPESELSLYKRNTIENLKFQRSQPNFLANEQVGRILYGEHPYATISPSPDDIEKLKRQSLQEHHASSLVPNNAVLIVVGDFEQDQLLAKLEEVFDRHWPKGEPPKREFDTPPDRSAVTITIVDRPGSAQANIVLSNLAAKRNDPDYFAAVVMNQVLGAGASSRVFMNLREEKGYTYGAYTRLNMKKLAGDFEATAEVRTAVTGDSIREFLYELKRIRETPVSEDELADAKNFLKGVFPIRAETQEGLTNLIVNQQLYGLPQDYLQTYRENIDAVTADDVQWAAAKLIQPEKLAFVIVGDGREILAQTSEFASDIEIYDTEGTKKDMAELTAEPAAPASDLSGKWSLSLDFQGQKVPVTLKIEQEGAVVTGTLDTILGSGTISGGRVTGNKLTATATTEMQGEAVEFTINAEVESDSITGTITAPIVPNALPFTGTRDN
ncbi:MAG: pitrilysin family protein [Acidobacteriota bacterium]